MHSDFCFLRHSQTHPTKRLWLQPLSTSMQMTSPMTSSIKFWLSVIVPQNVSKSHKRTTIMLKILLNFIIQLDLIFSFHDSVAAPGNEVRGHNMNFPLLPCPGFCLVPRLL